MLFCQIRIPGQIIKPAQLEMCAGVVGLKSDSLCQYTSRFRFFTGLKIYLTQIAQRLRITRCESNCFFEKLNGAGRVALSFVGQAKLIFCLKVGRIDLQTMPKLFSCRFYLIALRRQRQTERKTTARVPWSQFRKTSKRPLRRIKASRLQRCGAEKVQSIRVIWVKRDQLFGRQDGLAGLVRPYRDSGKL